MDALIAYFRQSLEFSQYDYTVRNRYVHLKLRVGWILIVLFIFIGGYAGIILRSYFWHNAIGNTLKDRLVASKVCICLQFQIYF